MNFRTFSPNPRKRGKSHDNIILPRFRLGCKFAQDVMGLGTGEGRGSLENSWARILASGDNIVHFGPLSPLPLPFSPSVLPYPLSPTP